MSLMCWWCCLGSGRLGEFEAHQCLHPDLPLLAPQHSSTPLCLLPPCVVD